jgi:hypothetical protein
MYAKRNISGGGFTHFFLIISKLVKNWMRCVDHKVCFIFQRNVCFYEVNIS